MKPADVSLNEIRLGQRTDTDAMAGHVQCEALQPRVRKCAAASEVRLKLVLKNWKSLEKEKHN